MRYICKQLKKLFPLLLMLTLLFSIPVHAEDKEGNIYYVDRDGRNFIISIVYEHNDVKVSLKDPEGNPVALNAQNISVIQDETGMLIYVENAKAGQWKMVYDKGSNAELQVAAYAVDEPLQLSNLSVGSPDGENKIPVSFRADHEPQTGFHYQIRLGTEETMDVYRILQEGDAQTGEDVNIGVSFDSVNSFESYYLQVYAYFEKDGLQYFDVLTGDAFAYTNPTSPDPIEDYDVTVNLTTHTVTVNIDSFAGDTSVFEFTLSEDGQETGSVLVDKRSTGGEASLQYGDAPQQMTASVTVQRGDKRVSASKDKVIDLANGSGKFFVKFPDSGKLTNYSYPLAFENAKDSKVNYRFQNGGNQEITLNGNGIHEIEIPEDAMSIEVSYTTDDRITYKVEQVLAVDTIPPTLKIYEALNGTVTEADSVILTGKTDPGAVLTLDETPVEIQADGGFTLELSLEQGENSFVIEAEDEAGNVSTYLFNITRGKKSDGGAGDASGTSDGKDYTGFTGKVGKLYWPIILGYTGLMLLAAFLTGFIGRKKRTMRKTITRTALILVIFSCIGTAANLIYFLMRRNFQNSSKYIDFASAEMEKAYKYLQLTDAVKGFFFAFLAVFAASFLTAFIGRDRKKS